jgi:hypothetical protein
VFLLLELLAFGRLAIGSDLCGSHDSFLHSPLVEIAERLPFIKFFRIRLGFEAANSQGASRLAKR